MGKLLVYNLATGEILNRELCVPRELAELMIAEGQGLVDGDGVDWRRNRVDLETGECVPCKPIRPDDTADFTYSWNEAADDWVATPTDEKLDREARAERKRLYAECDWVTLRAYRTATPVPEDWAQYMQDLADITDQPGYPRTFTWPTPPEK